MLFQVFFVDNYIAIYHFQNERKLYLLQDTQNSKENGPLDFTSHTFVCSEMNLQTFKLISWSGNKDLIHVRLRLSKIKFFKNINWYFWNWLLDPNEQNIIPPFPCECD